MNLPQAMSLLRQNFHELRDDSTENTRPCHGAAIPCIDVYEFAEFATQLHDEDDDVRLCFMFSMMEEFLVLGAPELRDWVCASIEAIQNIIFWRSHRPTGFAQLLGTETHAIWVALERIHEASLELDLGDSTVLEAEILTWRFTREKTRALSLVA
jgi:hypothetical protein